MLPSEAERELQNDAGHLVPRVLYLRSFQRAHQRYTAHQAAVAAGQKPSPLPSEPMLDMVKRLDLEGALARLKAKQEADS